MLFILKKKKEKRKRKMLVTKEKKKRKNHSSQTHSAPNWKGGGVEDWKQGPVFEELYELFKDYFHMAASDIEEFAVRDT